MIRLPRTLRLDRSDTLIFDRAAEPGEWAVPGSFAFWDDAPGALSGRRQQAFRAGFLGLGSFARSLCDRPPGTVLAMTRRHDPDGAVREQFRTLHRRDGPAERTRLPVFAAVSEEGEEAEPERPDLAALARERR